MGYTKFALKNLRLSEREIPTDGRLVALVEIQNVGPRSGDEIVQLYIRDMVASVSRPVRELRGFERVTLRPGECRTLTFAIGPEDLGFFDREMRFVVEPGRFEVIVGNSSEGGLSGLRRRADDSDATVSTHRLNALWVGDGDPPEDPFSNL